MQNAVIEPEPGLRERKRLATAHAIEEHAVRLVDAHGYAAVTVEMICAAAEISRRTFFNYFPSKAEAVLGPTVERLDERASRAFLAEPTDDLIAGIVDVALASLAAIEWSEQLVSARMRLMHTDPTLFQAQVSALDHLHARLVELARRHLDAHPESRRLTDRLGLEAEAELAASVAGAALRHGMTVWLADQNQDRRRLTRETVALIHRFSRPTT